MSLYPREKIFAIRRDELIDAIREEWSHGDFIAIRFNGEDGYNAAFSIPSETVDEIVAKYDDDEIAEASFGQIVESVTEEGRER